MQVILARPRGFCAGVDRAIAIVERALALFGPPIYVRHEVVHNRFVVENLRQAGVIFTDAVEEIPPKALVIFSAHGVSLAIQEEAKRKQWQVFDATCPLVTKVHMEVARCARLGKECILIGHSGHPEVEGTLGQYQHSTGAIYLVESKQDAHTLALKNPAYCYYVTQTTLSVKDTAEIIAILTQRFPQIESAKKEDICYATTNRQRAVEVLAAQCDVVIVVGSPESSNSNRLKEIAERTGTVAYLVDGAEDLVRSWFVSGCRIGVTAGASAPEVLVQGVISQLRDWGATSVEESLSAVEETVHFALPKALRENVS
eukprot:TRINITY_DN14617_c0_g3_i1.p2 TRINITY_DN14617_c0_g3~~TRINITY_DN14617_c0_g3_i1.p2  ORF type:complete len:315 (+),score=-60.87 TRINITY_DN14617_c0_g3_i1:3277-4221(+)